jgi:pyruvate kinase
LSLACHAAEVRSGDLTAPLQLATGDKVVFTIIEGADGTDNRVGVNYDDFVDDASVGDTLLVDGGIMSLEVTRITDTGGCACGQCGGGDGHVPVQGGTCPELPLLQLPACAQLC